MKINIVIETDGKEVSIMANESDWAKKAAGRYVQSRDKMVADTEALIVERQMLTHEGAQLWQELRETIRQCCLAFNREVGEEILAFELVQNSTIKIRRVRPEGLLKGEYSDDLHTAKIGDRRFQIAVDRPAGKTRFVEDGNAIRVSEIAESVLGQFMSAY